MAGSTRPRRPGPGRHAAHATACLRPGRQRPTRTRPPGARRSSPAARSRATRARRAVAQLARRRSPSGRAPSAAGTPAATAGGRAVSKMKVRPVSTRCRMSGAGPGDHAAGAAERLGQGGGDHDVRLAGQPAATTPPAPAARARRARARRRSAAAPRARGPPRAARASGARSPSHREDRLGEHHRWAGRACSRERGVSGRRRRAAKTTVSAPGPSGSRRSSRRDSARPRRSGCRRELASARTAPRLAR